MSAGKGIMTAVAKGFKKEWPKIAVGFGAGLLVFGGYLLGKEVPKYKKVIEEREKESGEKMQPKEKAKLAVKHFAAPAGAIIGGSLFLVASVCESEKRINMSTAAVAISEVATKNLADYASAAKEVLGEEGDKEVKKKVKEKKLKDAPPISGTPTLPDSGKSWCYDLVFGGQPFLTTVNDLKTAENEITARLLGGEDICLNEAYDLIGHERVEAADAFGWKYDDMRPTTSNKADFDIGTMIKDGVPVLTITPNVKIIDGGLYGIPDYGF